MVWSMITSPCGVSIDTISSISPSPLASDVFLGWTHSADDPNASYVRQLRTRHQRVFRGAWIRLPNADVAVGRPSDP
jgi:hypothetical protein